MAQVNFYDRMAQIMGNVAVMHSRGIRLKQRWEEAQAMMASLGKEIDEFLAFQPFAEDTNAEVQLYPAVAEEVTPPPASPEDVTPPPQVEEITPPQTPQDLPSSPSLLDALPHDCPGSPLIMPIVKEEEEEEEEVVHVRMRPNMRVRFEERSNVNHTFEDYQHRLQTKRLVYDDEEREEGELGEEEVLKPLLKRVKCEPLL